MSTGAAVCTLGDLRDALAARGGPPPAGVEIGLEFGPARAGYLPDLHVVDADVATATAAGTFDHLPACTPLCELDGHEDGQP